MEVLYNHYYRCKVTSSRTGSELLFIISLQTCLATPQLTRGSSYWPGGRTRLATPRSARGWFVIQTGCCHQYTEKYLCFSNSNVVCSTDDVKRHHDVYQCKILMSNLLGLLTKISDQFQSTLFSHRKLWWLVSLPKIINNFQVFLPRKKKQLQN